MKTRTVLRHYGLMKREGTAVRMFLLGFTGDEHDEQRLLARYRELQSVIESQLSAVAGASTIDEMLLSLEEDEQSELLSFEIIRAKWTPAKSQ